MKNLITTAFIALSSSLGLLAGSINVVHIGPTEVLKLEVSTGAASLDFTLAHGDNSGPFLLPDKPATIKGFIDKVPALDLPASEKPRIAILAPDKDGYKWHTIKGNPTEGKWIFRIINLADQPADITANKEPLEIPAGAETTVAVKKKFDINIKIPDNDKLSYDGAEPSGVIAFLYRHQEEWKAIFIPDR